MSPVSTRPMRSMLMENASWMLSACSGMGGDGVSTRRLNSGASPVNLPCESVYSRLCMSGQLISSRS